MWKALQTSLFLLLALIYVNGDVYLHNPRGSNNRLNENSKTRRNNNRLFDSQNNNNGGYNVGDATSEPSGNNATNQYQMKYFQSGSPKEDSSTYLAIEWTNQHGCGGAGNQHNEKVNCNIVLQYMCQPNDGSVDETDKFRDGTITASPIYSSKRSQYASIEAQREMKMTDFKKDRGLHENWEWYDRCKYRLRNYGLFTADQRFRRFARATSTRQNRNGKRSGYECPEERDYYPYWHSTPWIDIAVLAESSEKCKMYSSQSFNSRPYEECVEEINNGTELIRHSNWNNRVICVNRKGIWLSFHNFLEKAPQFTDETSCTNAGKETGMHYVWGLPSNAKHIKYECLVPPPKVICTTAPYSRVNHNGNGLSGKANTFNWALPHFPSGKEQRCVLRIRYNISTSDYNPETTYSGDNGRFIRNNPTVNFGKVPLKLAINTAQFGRVFQDRSHVFILRKRPINLKHGRIFNLNVRGKRGNIVQVYPAVEYDFVPNTILMTSNDFLHLQWTGSNTNPKNFAGEGKAGTDRNNLLTMQSLSKSYPLPFGITNSLWSNSHIAWIHHGNTVSSADLAIDVASSGYYNCLKSSSCPNSISGNSVDKKKKMSDVLDNAPASYEGVVLQIERGKYYYMCTRNNQFTNRSQKGSLIVS